MKLYPPTIEGTLPAFSGDIIKVPYEMNKAVSQNQISGFSIKIKTVQSNYYLGDIDTVQYENNVAIFTVPPNILNKLNIGQFYKVQLAYKNIGTNDIGYYSTIGVIKYTSEPTVTILDSTDGITFIGKYSQEKKDVSEKVYSYCFELKDGNNNLIETSGNKIHNSSFDTEIYESIDKFTLSKELENGKTYFLNYTITTVNNLIRTSSSKRLIKTDSIDSKLRTDLIAELDYENGYIDLRLDKPKEDEVEQSAVGSFMLLRASDEDNYSSWNEVLKFVLYGQQPSRHLWKDMTIKQGVNYKYAIQQYNEHGLRSNKIISNNIYADFEHAFLFDGERQLKIKYNPKVSSFKNTLLESKVDTIGSKHPFIFRNGNVNYKEFPISGMISYLSDENDLFYDLTSEFKNNEYRKDTKSNEITEVSQLWGPITKDKYIKYFFTYYVKHIVKNDKTGEVIDEYFIPWNKYLNNNHPTLNIMKWDDVGAIINTLLQQKLLYEKWKQQQYVNYDNDKIRSTNLTSHNIHVERNFKLEVLEWLTNGKPKLFRSPSEGNYLVRLLNVSMSPQDSLNRMLHTFNCTAYEVADYSYTTLEEYNIITTANPTTKQLRWHTIDLSNFTNENLLKYPASAIRFDGMAPGDKVWIDDGVIRNGKSGYSVVIGTTGSYIVNLNNNILINNIHFENSNNDKDIRHQGSLTYAYYTTDFKDSFDTVTIIETNEVPSYQFIGAYNNILKELINVKQQIQSIDYIRFYLRDSEIEIYEQDENQFSLDAAGTNPIDPRELTDLYLLHKKDGSTVYYDWCKPAGEREINPNQKDYEPHEATTIVFNNDEEYKVDLWDIYSYELRPPQNLTSIKTGDGIICEITYQSKNITYDVESNIDKTELNDAKKNFNKVIQESDTTLDEIITAQNKYKDAYNKYLTLVEQAIIEAERG